MELLVVSRIFAIFAALIEMISEIKCNFVSEIRYMTKLKTVESHRNGAAPNDDMTMLVIRCRNL